MGRTQGNRVINNKVRVTYLASWLFIILIVIGLSCFTMVGFGSASDGRASQPDQNPNTRSRADTDSDGLSDDAEVVFGTDQFDPDSDDDGVLDGDEGLDISKPKDHSANDPDGDGWNNAMDADSDGDGVLDGTEKGLTDDDINYSATDKNKGRFFPDLDPSTTTDMTKWDTDGDTWSDGDEDRNANGKYEPTLGEKDPNFKDYDDDSEHDDTVDEDDDNDGMPDEFEKMYPDALDPLDPSDASKDYDMDGFSNLREYRGNDDKEGNNDWSDPTDPTSMPNIAPKITFYGDETTIDEEGNTIQRIIVEAKQKITFNSTLLRVTDENAKLGLKYKWDWGDGSDIYIQDNVKPGDLPTSHTYNIPSTYTIVLTVEDNIHNEGVGKLIVDVTHPEGASELLISIPRSKSDLEERNTIQRSGWIAYLFEDVRAGDKITFDLSVEQRPEVTGKLGIRVFVLPKDNLDTYKQNEINLRQISRKYEQYWSGPVGRVTSEKKIVIEAEEDDDIVVILDNRYYEEGKSYINFDEPIDCSISINRDSKSIIRKGGFEWPDNYVYMMASVIAIYIIIFLSILLYTKMHRARMLEHKTRGEIFSYINKHPGVHYRGVLNDLNLNMGVLTHHLNMLEQQQYIKSYQDGMYRRFYPIDVKVDGDIKITEVQSLILRKIKSKPGISQTEIARELNQNRKSVHYNIKRLSDEGLIHVEPVGRETKCYYIDRGQLATVMRGTTQQIS